MKLNGKPRGAVYAIAFGLLMAASGALAQDVGDRDAVYRVIGGSHVAESDAESLLWVRWKSNFIELQDPNSSVGYAYHRLRGGRLELFQLFHSYETAIRYELRDAWLFDDSADFTKEVQFWDGTLLGVLDRREESSDDSRAAIEYTGIVDGAQIEIQWLKSEQIPGRIRITTPNRVVSFDRLAGPSGIPVYDWPEWESNYEDIDFVDLADREEHPIASLIHAELHARHEGH
jgi:hypothetical protein